MMYTSVVFQDFHHKAMDESLKSVRGRLDDFVVDFMSRNPREFVPIMVTFEAQRRTVDSHP